MRFSSFFINRRSGWEEASTYFFCQQLIAFLGVLFLHINLFMLSMGTTCYQKFFVSTAISFMMLLFFPPSFTSRSILTLFLVCSLHSSPFTTHQLLAGFLGEGWLAKDWKRRKGARQLRKE
ncbi:hypothetical protein QBC40DRAFT_70159 [Triangularia verruculosa]|uniref:Uncharacterized protein n=1 Tax=Triangularia verruculosa TaxID=2587418 RepID=A0AAN7AVG2_9PEZI|nr:hypothetical protein QBC40DRAFT_70159 [Triangularia verruculosa]